MPLDAEAIQDERRHILPAANHCPYGCEAGDLDEYGYCGHLVGFTNDGKTYEPVRQRVSVQVIDGEKVETPGNKWVDGRKPLPVERGDRLVNPKRQAVVDGVLRVIEQWVSARVYRKSVENKAKA